MPSVAVAPPAITQQIGAQVDDRLEAATRKLEELHLIPAQSRPQFNQQPRRPSPPTEPTAAGQFYPNWPHSITIGRQLATSPIPPENPLNDIIVRQQQQQQQPSSNAGSSPLLLTLVALSLLVCVALVVVVALGSSGNKTPLVK